MDTTETKAEAYHRLIDEGRWEEASAYRVEQQRAFRKIGKSPDEARALSWVDTIAHFPPTEETLARIQQQEEKKAAKLAAEQKTIAARESKLVDPAVGPDGDPDDPESIAGAELDELQTLTGDKDVDFEADLLWAYRNLGKRKGTVRPLDAPSPGAWTLLDYSHKNRTKFIEAVMKHLGKRVVEKRKNRQDDSMEQYEMLAQFEKLLAEQA